MKIFVLNSKGGVGKSAVSAQIAAPFIWVRNGRKGKVNLIEFDVENNDNEMFSQNSAIIKTSALDAYNKEALLKLAQIRDCVIDSGGNIQTSAALEEFAAANILRKIDLFMVPLTAGIQDVTNTLNTVDVIRQYRPGAKIILVLSMVYTDPAVQFWWLLGDKWHLYKESSLTGDYAGLASHLMAFSASPFIDMAKGIFGETLFEKSEEDITKIEAEMDRLAGELAKYEDGKAPHEIDAAYDQALREQRIVYEAKKFREKCIDPAFNAMEEVLNAKQ